MRLQLLPPAPHPQILFSFTLPVLPSTLPFPPAYSAQLQLLLFTEVEPPPSPYALDKAVWAVHLIEIVIFDLANRRVEVKMVDGAYMVWEMRGEEMLLNQVMDDVEASKNEADREMREMERREQEEIAVAAAAAAAYLPMTHPGSVSDIGHYESKGSGSSKPMHRRSKSLFSSLLSALNLNSSTDHSPAPSSSSDYCIGGRAKKDGYEPQPSAAADDGEQFCYPAYAITALSTSDYTYPIRAQLARNDFSASKVLRRRARSTLVDCFRRWIIPTVREHLQWGAFPPFDDMPDLDGYSNVEGEGAKWGKMSKATNAYADWACRSMISRCERALRTANALVEGIESLSQTSSSEGGEVEKESRRSSASSMLTSAISSSSRASSSAEQVYSGQDTELDNSSPISPVQKKLQTPTPTAASIKASKRTSASVRHFATLRTALDRFRGIHEILAMEAIGLADSHTMAMRVLEARGRRKAWSSSEGGGLCRPSPLGSPPTTSGRASSLSEPRVNKLNAARTEQVYGSGNSLWELSIPLQRSTLGEISDTWEDWQMEWEMEKEFGSEVEFDDEDGEEFPGIISDFDVSGDSILTGYEPKAGRRSDASTSYDEDPTECGHSGFSDSSSSEEEMGGSDSDDISDRTPSPTSPSDLQGCSVDGKVGKARRGRRTGVKARMGKYEDVRNELPPDPPLMALSPPPRGKLAASRQAPSGDAGIGSSPVYNEHDKTTGRLPRPARPSRLQVPSNDVTGSHHCREGASGAYPEFAQSHVDDTEAGVFDEWDAVGDDDGVFGCPSSSKPGATSHITKAPVNSADPCKPLRAFQIFDGLGILEQVGGVTEATRKPLGHAYSIQNGVGIGYPPGLHGDLPPPPSSPTKRTITPPESPRRVSHYISRELPLTSSDASAVVPHAPPLVMEKESKRAGRPRPRLTLAFPDPPSYNPAEAPTERISSLPYTRPFESTDSPLGGVSHVGGSTNQVTIVSSTEGGERTCLSKMENDSPALLLDTPTAEYPSSSYPYKWEVNILPPGVKVIGTVGVSPASTSSEMVVERSTFPDTPGCVASSSGGSPFNAVAKVLNKVRKVKPVLYVTPPPPPSAEDTQETQQPIRLVKLNRSKSWKELSVAGGINFRAEIMKRRRSADSVPTVLHSGVDTPASPQPSQEEGDRTVILDDPPSLSPENIEADSASPMSALSRTQSELESGWATPSLVSSPSSITSSGFNSLNSTALDIFGDPSSTETDSNGHSEAYDGIVMVSHTYHQSEPTIVTSGGEKYSIQEGWFPKPAEDATAADEPVIWDSVTPAEAAASTCPVASSGSTGPRKLKRAHSATRSDRTERPPPPPRPVKSIKRSLSLSTFGRKVEAPVPANE